MGEQTACHLDLAFVQANGAPVSEPIKLLLVDDNPSRARQVIEALSAQKDIHILSVQDSLGVLTHARAFEPNMILVSSDVPARDTIDGLKGLGQEWPVVMFVDEANNQGAAEALRAGVCAYVIDGQYDVWKIRSILSLATAQFTVMAELRNDLKAARRDLSNRKLIERAKGLIMARRGIDEDGAYRLMRQAAMKQGRTLADIAERLLEAENLLGNHEVDVK